MNKLDLRSLEYDQLTDFFIKNNHPKFRADQTFNWIHSKKAQRFDEMTNLSKELRSWLEENAFLANFKLKDQQASKIDGTIKYLFQLEDSNCIETVQMEYKHGNSLCVSTQVGCKMGCKFCASTLAGLVRNLSTSEILNQVYEAENLSGKRVSNIVLMGIGEPLDNFEQVVGFLRIISNDRGLKLSLRNIALSTCGVVPKIRELADLNFPITLSVSLHSPNNKAREALMPINKRWNINEVIAACKYYIDQTHRRITFEYALIDGVNDSKKEALALADLLKGLNAHINLIPINPITDKPFNKSSKKGIKKFAEILTKKGFSTTIRRELGSDILAACGQLRHLDSLDS